MDALKMFDPWFPFYAIDAVLRPLFGAEGWAYMLAFAACIGVLIVVSIVGFVLAVEKLPIPPRIAQTGVALGGAALSGLYWIPDGWLERFLWPAALAVLPVFVVCLIAAFRRRQDEAENVLASSLGMTLVRSMPHQTFGGRVDGLKAVMELSDIVEDDDSWILLALEAPAPCEGETFIAAQPGGRKNRPLSELFLPELPAPRGWASAGSFYGRDPENLLERFGRMPPPGQWDARGARLARLSLGDGTLTFRFSCSSLDAGRALTLARVVRSCAEALGP